MKLRIYELFNVFMHGAGSNQVHGGYDFFKNAFKHMRALGTVLLTYKHIRPRLPTRQKIAHLRHTPQGGKRVVHASTTITNQS